MVICFVDMLECCSIVYCCILSAMVLLIADLRHSCFACHLQTVHSFPVILISISTKITHSFQWHTWFAKLMPWSSFPFWSTHMHCTSYLASHTMSCIMLLVHCTMIDCCFVACVIALGRAWRRVRGEGSCWVRLRGASFRQLWELCRQDDHYPRYHFYLCLLVALFYCYATLPITCLPCLRYCHAKYLTHLS